MRFRTRHRSHRRADFVILIRPRHPHATSLCAGSKVKYVCAGSGLVDQQRRMLRCFRPEQLSTNNITAMFLEFGKSLN